MTDQKDQKPYQLNDNDKDFSKSVHHWLAQYDEEDDFLSENVPSSLPDITEEK